MSLLGIGMTRSVHPTGDRLVSKKTVCKLLGISLSKLNYITDPKCRLFDPGFPKRRSIGRAVKFSLFEVMKYGGLTSADV